MATGRGELERRPRSVLPADVDEVGNVLVHRVGGKVIVVGDELDFWDVVTADHRDQTRVGANPDPLAVGHERGLVDVRGRHDEPSGPDGTLEQRFPAQPVLRIEKP